ncbi:hypothetical protein HYC85_024274 [Camellia sinensis]|uniref:Uncharacterized protein n=1 Tax=Camellia sinensis TaxID=4442 RepID=A0A7J7GB99_CAMSI|nr:hypothetical protein HYC85_024274 [Camellia sinensis]
MYLMNCTRPDIVYAVSKLSRYTSNPGVEHWKAIIRVLRYLRFTHNIGLHYTRYPAVLEGYCDANWISDTRDSKSTSGYVITLGGAAVSWKSSKQTCIARSTMESEFIALDKAEEEAEWLRHFLEDIPIWPKPVPAICIHCDSQSAIGRAQSHMYNASGIHIEHSVPSWRTTAAALDSPKYAPSQSCGGRSRPVSARNLAATLWEMNEVPLTRPVSAKPSMPKVILLKAICDLYCCFPLDSAKAQFIHVVDCPNFFFVALIVEAQEAVAAIEAGANVAGGRGFYLKGDGVRLNQALINFGLDFVEKRGYTALQTPFFMRKDIMAKCAQLAQFDEELYKNSLDTKVEKSRKQLKERKNRTKKIRGVKKTKAGDGAKAGKKK